MVTNRTVVIISQYIHGSHHHVVHLKLTYVTCQLYPSKAGGEKAYLQIAKFFKQE